MENTQNMEVEFVTIEDDGTVGTLEPMDADTDAGTVETSGDAPTTEGTVKREKTVEYRQKSTIPPHIDAMRPNLIKMVQDAVCGLNADSVEPNTPDNLKFTAKVGKHGMGIALETWLSGPTLDKDGKPIQASFELSVSLRAIHPQSGARNGYTLKAKREAEEVLMFEDYEAVLLKKVSDKTFKNRAIAAAKIPFAAWCKQKRVNMTINEKNAEDVNAANKARLDAWSIRVDAKCKELAEAEPLNLDDIE